MTIYIIKAVFLIENNIYINKNHRVGGIEKVKFLIQAKIKK